MDNQFLTTLVLLAVSGSIALTTKRELQAQLLQEGARSKTGRLHAHPDPVVIPGTPLSCCTATLYAGLELIYGSE